jgi:PKD repeat protein
MVSEGPVWTFTTVSETEESEISLTLEPPQVNDLTVTVSGTITATNSTVTRLNWQWGDATSGDQWFPAAHTYTVSGTYPITATAYDDLGNMAVVTTAVQVAEPASEISLTLEPPQVSDLTVTVSGTVTATNSAITRLNWQWGDGTSGDQWFPAMHTYTISGTYPITATAYDDLGNRAVVTNTVQVTEDGIIRVSIASDGTQGNGNSYPPSISADARFVAFASEASNLVDDDTNGHSDIFIHDRKTGETTRLPVAGDGTQSNGGSYRPLLSADGRFVAFSSDASNLVDNDTNNYKDVFLHDRQTGETIRVSVASDGTEGDRESEGPSVSGDGRFVAFSSYAGNLVDNGTKGRREIYLHDRQTRETTRVSVASDGTPANSYSGWPAISGDGRLVAFESAASNLVLGDTNDRHDVFVHDRQTGETTRVSVASDGTQGNGWSEWASISADGRFVAFSSASDNLVDDDTNNHYDLFVHDRQTGETIRASVASDGTEGNGWTQNPASFSADGRFVAFDSWASTLVPGDTNGVDDIFIHDLQRRETIRVSVADDGTQSNGGSWWPFLSGDGRFVAFLSRASNLVPGDSNGADDVFVRTGYIPASEIYLTLGSSQVSDLTVTMSGTVTATYSSITRLNWQWGDGAGGDQWFPAVHTYTVGGTYPITATAYDDLGNTAVVTTAVQLGETMRVSVASNGTEGDDNSWNSSISGGGRFVAFGSSASNLVSGDTNGVEDIFVHDRQMGETTRVSVASDGTGGNDFSLWPSISGDGRFVAFSSGANNLVPDDTNDTDDIFVHDRQTGETMRVSLASDGTEGNESSREPYLSDDGRFVVFSSVASNLVLNDTNGYRDIFVRDRGPQ